MSSLSFAVSEVIDFLAEIKDYEDVPADLRLRAADLKEEIEEAWSDD